MVVRPAAVAGTFYSGDPAELRRRVEDLLAHVAIHGDAETTSDSPPRALIVPHAGFVYSGPVAASAYRQLSRWADDFPHVLLLGPCHRVPFDGLAVSGADAWETPLGVSLVDRAGRDLAMTVPGVHVHDEAHRGEHSLEVQLPFLQTVLPNAAILPVLAGRTTASEVCGLLEQFLDRPGWLVVISSDLSHFHPAEICEQLDAATSAVLERLADDELDGKRACGHWGIRGLLQAARRRHWQVRTLDLRHSGQTAGPRDSVVGYGAYVVC